MKYLNGQNRLRLTTLGSLSDIAHLGIQLQDDLALTVTMDNADENGKSDDLMADAQIDGSKIENRSERKKAAERKRSLGLKNGSTPVAKKTTAVKRRKPTDGRTTRKTAKRG